MKLEGKCRGDFSKWYIEEVRNDPEKLLGATNYEWFLLLTESMRWGVIIDFADSVGVTIIIDSDWNFNTLGESACQTFEYYIHKNINEEAEYESGFKTRPEARETAVNKFNEWYNNK